MVYGKVCETQQQKEEGIKMRKLAILCILSILVLSGCTASPLAPETAPTPAPTPTPPAPALPEETGGTEKVTLADAPTILDLSSELPGDFDYETSQHRPGYEYVKLGLDPWSEWHIFSREEPFQVARSTMTILSSEAEIIACDELLEDTDRIQSVYVAWYQGEKMEDWDLISMDVHPADIGDVAILILTEATTQGYIFKDRILYFRCENVVVLVSTLYSIEEPPIIELARTIEQRIRNY